MGADLRSLPETEGLVPGMYGEPDGGIAGGAMPDTARDNSWRPMGEPPPVGTPNASCIIPANSGTAGVPDGEMSGTGDELDRD